MILKIKYKNIFYKTLIDEEDYEKINKYKWYIVFKKQVPYVFTQNKPKTIYLARYLLGVTNNHMVDHKNGNTLDNRKSNLRICDKRQNAQNMKSNKNTSSKFKGVCFDNNRNKWRANIFINNKQYFIGRFDSEIKAAEEYNKFAIKYFGEFANINK